MSQMSGNVSVNRNVESSAEGADITSSSRQFHTWGPATENARLPTVEWWTRGWTRLSLQSEV